MSTLHWLRMGARLAAVCWVDRQAASTVMVWPTATFIRDYVAAGLEGRDS